MATAFSEAPAERRPVAGRAHNLGPAYLLSGALAVVVLIAALAGLLIPDLFRDPAMSVGNARGTNLVMLTVALPAVVASMLLAARGSLRAQIVWLGGLAYLLYNAVPFAFAMAFNRLFLLYIAALSLALWSLVALLMRVDLERLGASFTPATPVRAIAAYLLAMTALFALAWLRDIIPAIVANTTPASLNGTDMLTNWVQVLDLGFTLPLCALAAIWLWQRRSWGYLLAGLLLTMLTIETASVAMDQVFGHLSDPSATLAMVPLFVVLTLIGLALTVVYLRTLRPDARGAAA